MNHLFKKLLIGVVIAALLYAIGAIFVGTRDLAATLSTFDATVLVPVLVLTLTNYLLRFAKWEFYLRILGERIALGTNLVIFLGGLSMTITPGKVGELLKAYLLRSTRGVPMARTAPIVLAERVTDLIGLLLLMSTGVFVFDHGKVLLGMLAAGVALLWVVIASESLSTRIIRLVTSAPRLAQIGAKLDQFYQSTRILLCVRPLLLATALSIVAWFCECYGFYWVLKGLDHPIRLASAIFIYSATTIGGLPTPGGIGLMDGGMTALLKFAVRLPLSVAAAATLIIRLCTLWFAVFVGATVLLLFRKRVGLSKDATIPTTESDAAART